MPPTVNVYDIASKACIKGSGASSSSGCTQGSIVCRKGRTSNKCNTVEGSDGYSGCNRTVCNWYAANKICAYAGMKLPTNAQIDALKFNPLEYHSVYVKTQTNLCDSSKSEEHSHGMSGCRSTYTCEGAGAKTCTPSEVWDTEYDSYSAHYFKLDFGYVDASYSYHTSGKYNSAFSVRCVK